jgi:hypothetical protein
MIKYYIHEKMHLDIAKSFQIIYDTYNSSAEDLNLDMTGK